MPVDPTGFLGYGKEGLTLVTGEKANGPGGSIIERLERIEKLLTQEAVRPMSLREAAAYTGISVSYMYKLTSESQIPHYKPRGKIVYFLKCDLDKWLTRKRVHTIEELDVMTKERRGKS